MQKEFLHDLLLDKTALSLPEQALQGITPSAKEQFGEEILIEKSSLQSIPLLADIDIEPVQEWVHQPSGQLTARPLLMVTCQTCYNRYYTPGTPYYLNQAALTTCLKTCT